jgi:CBS domain-containing protein
MDQKREAMKVRDVMTRAVDYIAADETVQEAARRMKRLGTGRLAVVTNSEAVGMITDRDLVRRTVAPGLDPGTTEVAAVMTEGLVVCREDDSLDIAARMMERRRLCQLVVINPQGELCGILSIGVLVEQLPPQASLHLLQAVLA